jgi:predicted AAA+ superfamily ATPase
MEILLQKSEMLVKRTEMVNHRFLYFSINWKNRLIGIKGARGTGKTTLLLQKLKNLNLSVNIAAYFSLDDLYFSVHSLVETAEEFYKMGGQFLFLDEVHKYTNWAMNLKNLYDFYPDLKVVFTGSSIIDISKEEVDLSRRVLMHELPGLSYREFLAFKMIGNFETLTIETILSPKRIWKEQFPVDFRPLAYFQEYLKMGYYPFAFDDPEGFNLRLHQLIRNVVEIDMAELSEFDIRNAKKMLQFMYVLASNVPMKPNISALADKIQIHRNTVINYLHFLEQAKLIRQLYHSGISLSIMQKPEKVYLENTNLSFAFETGQPDLGNLRETFFASQVAVNHTLTYPAHGDFFLDGKWTFEIGGKNKSHKQIKDISDSFIVADNSEYPVSSLPLWLFGFLY